MFCATQISCRIQYSIESTVFSCLIFAILKYNMGNFMCTFGILTLICLNWSRSSTGFVLYFASMGVWYCFFAWSKRAESIYRVNKMLHRGHTGKRSCSGPCWYIQLTLWFSPIIIVLEGDQLFHVGKCARLAQFVGSLTANQKVPVSIPSLVEDWFLGNFLSSHRPWTGTLSRWSSLIDVLLGT